MKRSFQEQMTENHCFGCGPNNPAGLRVKGYWLDDDPDSGKAYCDFKPEPHHNAGMPHYLNGGVIATVMDCHSVITAVAHAYHTEGRAIGEGDTLWYVTGSLTVNYLKPVPIDQVSRFIATIQEVKGKKTRVATALYVGDQCCANADVLAVRVPSEWLQPASPG